MADTTLVMMADSDYPEGRGRMTTLLTLAGDLGEVEVAGEKVPGLARVYGEGRRFLGVGEISANGRLAPRRVFQAPGKNPVDI